MVERRHRLLGSAAHYDALAGGEPVRLYHDGAADVLDVVVAGGFVVVEDRGRAGRDAAVEHDPLGEALARLDARGSLGRAECGKARIVEPVDDSRCQRRLRSHDREVDSLALRQGEQAVDVLGAYRDVAGDAGGAPVAGRDQQLADPRAPGELPGDRVLASAVAYDEQLHSHSMVAGGFEVTS